MRAAESIATAWISMARTTLATEAEPPATLEVAALDRTAIELYAILGELEDRKRAVNLAIATAKAELGAVIDRDGPVRLGDYAYTVGRPTKRELLDWRAFAAWAGDDLPAIVSITARNVRITGVRALAERRYTEDHETVDPAELADYLQSVEDTFFDTTREEEPTLIKVPASRRKWAEKLDHGEHLEKRGKR